MQTSVVLRRMLTMLAAFCAAVIAATVVFLVYLWWPGVPPAEEGDTVFQLILATLAMLALFSVFIGAIVGLPALVLVVLAETFRWRGLLLHLVAGAAVGALGGFVGAPNDGPLTIAATAASGLVGGWVYWRIAGRNAGAWRA